MWKYFILPTEEDKLLYIQLFDNRTFCQALSLEILNPDVNVLNMPELVAVLSSTDHSLHVDLSHPQIGGTVSHTGPLALNAELSSSIVGPLASLFLDLCLQLLCEDASRKS